MTLPADALIELLDSQEWTSCEAGLRHVRTLAEESGSAQLEPVLEPRLLDLAGHPKWEVRRGLARVLAHYRSTRARLVLERLADDPQSLVARAAHEAKGRWGVVDRELKRRRDLEESLPERLRALQDSDPEAARAVEELAFRQVALLIAGLAHDLANSVFCLREIKRQGKALLAAAGADPAASRDLLQSIELQTDLLNALVQDSRSYATSADAPSSVTRLRQAVENALSRNLHCLQGAKVEVKVGDELTAFVPREPMERALGNLLRNAGEAWDGEPGVVTVRAFEDGDDWVVLEVEDNGIGMEDPSRCLQPYSSTKKSGEEVHSGLGLPIVSRIVESACGGSLRVHSALGQGTRVSLRLPTRPL